MDPDGGQVSECFRGVRLIIALYLLSMMGGAELQRDDSAHNSFTDSGQISESRSPESRRKMNNRQLKRLIRDAVKFAEEEEDQLKNRFDTGLDKLVNTFTTCDPLLLSESPLDASEIEWHSRRINWIARLLRERSAGLTLEDVLSHRKVIQQGIHCPYVPPLCGSSAYRSVDGSCNNLGEPLLGAAFTPFFREMPAAYETENDREDTPRRTTANGTPLPNARVISTTVHEGGSNNPQSDLTFHFTIWGQFLAHDVTDRAPGKGHNLAVIDCINQAIPTPDFTCFNIDVPEGDFFRGFGRDRLNFPRSTEVTDLKCIEGTRRQLNQASSFIDGGPIYGATPEKADFLRQYTGGELCMSEPNHLPYLSHPTPIVAKKGLAYMQAGDDRVTEFTGLTGIETIWPREHNRIARSLAELHPSWADEKLFQETRKIIIAMLQHITYNEWLPVAVGSSIMTEYGLNLLLSGFFTGYDQNVDPSVSNAFAGATLRFGHTLMRTTFSQVNDQFAATSSPALVLQDLFFKSNIYLLNEQNFMRGTVVDASEKFDNIVTSHLVNNLYQTEHGNGFDLPAFNIQRGREHGLVPYNAWRTHFGLTAATEFSTDPSSPGFVDIPQDVVMLLDSVYDHPGDVDLWTGGVCETPLPGAALGPLFANMMGRQFRDLRLGDRYWYETGTAPQAFTSGQLDEIRKVTYARVLCNTLDFTTIQPEAFKLQSVVGNSPIDCSSIAGISLSPWA